MRGLVLAVPDEDSDSPLDFVLYEDGEKRRAIVMDEDDESGVVRVLG
jgi:hypothetical protein